MQQVNSLEGDQTQQEQAGLPPQEGERSGPRSRRREGREAQEVHAGDVGLCHHAPPRRRMDLRAVLRSGEARRVSDGLQGNALQGVLPPPDARHAGQVEGRPAPLPKRRKQRKTRDRNAKKYRNAGRGKIPGRLDIDERPKAVENRARVGNREGDLVNGLKGTGSLVTLVERMTRFTLVARVATKEATVVAAAIIGMLGAVPKSMLKSLTFDNGKEFAEFCQLEQALGLKVYFAKPYHSWERGTNENRNGIVRMVLPKGRSFENILNAELERIDHLLNDRPVKCLDWRTPREAHNALLRRHALADAA